MGHVVPGHRLIKLGPFISGPPLRLGPGLLMGLKLTPRPIPFTKYIHGLYENC